MLIVLRIIAVYQSRSVMRTYWMEQTYYVCNDIDWWRRFQFQTVRYSVSRALDSTHASRDLLLCPQKMSTFYFSNNSVKN